FKTWPGGPGKPAVLSSKQGYNRFTWDFNREALPAVDNVFVFGNYAGANVAPGKYTLRLTLDKHVSETEVTILPNPKIEASASDFKEQQSILTQIEHTIKDIHESVNSMRSAKSQLKNYAKLLKENEKAKALVDKGEALIERIDTWEQNLIQPKQKTFQDVINFNNKLNAQLMHLKGYVDVAEPKVTNGVKERLQDLLADWNVYKDERNTIINVEMLNYNTLYKELGLPAIIIKD
ncbi:MAG: glycosyl hydrolase, partial [Chlorobi bacterium]|nr:glycosyl hydrolase [Chlorobiota bacterium]